MKKSTGLLAVKYGGLLMIVAGLVIIGLIVPSFPSLLVRITVLLVSLFIIIIGYLLYSKVNMYMKHGIGTRITEHISKTASVLLVAYIFLATMITPVFAYSNAGCSTYWKDLRDRVIFAEYIALSTTVVAALLAFGPVLFGRTILGPIVQELQPLAGSGLILMMVLLLLIYPLDVMFQPCGYNNNEYRIDMNQLKNNGPFLLRLLLYFQPTPPK